MKKEVIFVVGSSSWWKSQKFRKETCTKLKVLRSQKWRIRKFIRFLSNQIPLTPKFIKNIICINENTYFIHFFF